MMHKTIILITFLILVGCVYPPVKNYETQLQGHEVNNDVNVSESVLFITDTHETLEYRQGIRETTKALSELGVGVSNRPRALTKWGSSITEYILKKEAESQLVIHLGDILNNSCKTEWLDALKPLNKREIWFIIPGNHEGYYFGISSPTPSKNTGVGVLNEYRGWGAACVPLFLRKGEIEVDEKTRECHIFDKANFVKAYLDELEKRGLKISTASTSYNTVEKHSYQCSTPGDEYLSEICWAIDREEHWQSFIVQKINIHDSIDNSIAAVLLAIDTSSYPWQPSIGPWNNAYFHAELTPEVRDIMNRWLQQEKSKARPTIIAGHHPFEKFRGDSRSEMKNWWDQGIILNIP